MAVRSNEGLGITLVATSIDAWDSGASSSRRAKRRCDEPTPTLTVPPPSPALNEGTAFRVAAEPRTGFEQRGEVRRLLRATRAAMVLLADAPALELERARKFVAFRAKPPKRVPLVFAETAAAQAETNNGGSSDA